MQLSACSKQPTVYVTENLHCLFQLMLSYHFIVPTHPRPFHLPQDMQLKHPGTYGGREGGREGGRARRGDVKRPSGQEVTPLFSGSPRFSFQSHQKSLLSPQAVHLK